MYERRRVEHGRTLLKMSLRRDMGEAGLDLVSSTTIMHKPCDFDFLPLESRLHWLSA